MKSISILKHNLMRAAMTLALIVTCATAWAQNLTINSDDDWITFATNVSNGNTYSGYTVVLNANISVSTMAGSNQTNSFKGTFDGGGHTLTFNYTATEQYAAPFRYIDGATIENLHVDGTIQTSAKYAAGIAAQEYGTTHITNCRSSIVVKSSVNDDGTHSGFVAVNNDGTLTIEGCVFDGKLLTTNGTNNCGGFVGWKNGTLYITNSIYNPAVIDQNQGETEVLPGDGQYMSKTFARMDVNTITNCYYTRILGSAQGKHLSSITAGENVTNMVISPGNSTSTYSVSGITAYNNGLDYGGTLYYGNGDNVSLTLSTSLSESYFYYVTGGTLSSNGNSYTLTMPDADVTISAASYNNNITAISSVTDWVVFCAAVNGGHDYSNETVTLAGNVTVGTENNPVSSSYYMAGTSGHRFKGTFDGGGHTLTFYYSATTDDAAPFAYLEGATIENLHVNGSIQTSAKYAAGIAAHTYGATITNCQSSIVVKSSISGDGTHGGFVAVNESGTLDITGCLFNGKLLTTNGTDHCGGFVGWRNGTLNITNSIYNPAVIDHDQGETEVGATDTYTFGRRSVDNITNCYYTRTLGTAQGKQRHSITAGNNVTIENIALTGTSTPYNVSGITAYSGGGLNLNGTLYYGNGDNVSLTLSTTLPEPYAYSVTDGTLSSNSNPYTLTMPDADVTISALSSINEISSVNDWNAFCALVNNGHNYSGETVTLTADIATATTKAGTSSTTPFKGTFDGQGYTLTVNIASSGNQGNAPFRYIEDATIKNLTVGGTVTAGSGNDNRHAGGLVGFVQGTGTNTFQNCLVKTTVNSGSDYAGGIIGHGLSSNIVMEGCAYTGEIKATGTNYVGGLIGWSDALAGLTITDCLFAGTYTNSNSSKKFHPIGCTGNANNISSRTITNTYYTLDNINLNNDTHTLVYNLANQGKHGYTISGGTGVTVANAGTETTYGGNNVTHFVTGYGTGIKYNGVLYAGSGDEVSLTISGNLPEGYEYSASAGTLSGSDNPYTLTMPSSNVTISIGQGANGGQEQTLTVCDGTLTDEHIPIYGYWADGVQHGQMIYPASLLSDMAGGEISEITFHISSWGDGNGDPGNPWTVKVGITEATTFTAFDNTTELTQIFNGSMTYDDDHTTMSFTLDEPYTYSEGNLLFDFSTGSGSKYRHVFFYGVESTSSAVYNYSSYSATVKDFLPKTTFTYTMLSGYHVNAGTMSNGSIQFSTDGGNNWYDELSNVDADETVAISVEPETGYQLAGAPTVTPTSGIAPTVSGSGNLYSFVMPKSNVTVNATFNCTTPADPTFSVATGTYTTLQNVAISCATAGATIYYTTDGSDPTNSSTQYTGAITINSTTTLKAIAYIGTCTSNVTTATYTMDLPTYTVTCATGLTGGSIAASPASAVEGTTITITATTESGYFLATLTATDGNNTDVPVTIDGNTGTFTMPAANVTVNATFTQPNCPQPTNLTVSNLAAHSANVGWNGESESYTVQYRTATVTGTTVEQTYSYGFEDENLSGWTTHALGDNTPGTNWQVQDPTSTFLELPFNPHGGTYVVMTRSYNQYAYNVDNWLITPLVNLGDYVKFWVMDDGEWHEHFEVWVSTATNATEDFVWLATPGNATSSWTEVTVEMGEYARQQGYIAIRHTDHDKNFLFVDDFGIYQTTNTYDYGTAQNAYPTSNSCQLTSLSPETLYEVMVQGNCGTDGTSAWSSPMYFTTPDPTFTKDIVGYGDDNNVSTGWYLIASPLAGSTLVEDVDNLITTESVYDLYYFDQTGGDNGKEWKNWKAEGTDHYHFNLESGRGYLYANAVDVTLTFTGVPYSGNGKVTLSKDDNAHLGQWNLIGNPLSTNATLGTKPFYIMNSGGTEIIAADNNRRVIAPMQGVFVEANEDGETVTFYPQAKGEDNEASIVLNLAQNNAVIDRAIVRMGEGETLSKLQIRDGNTKVYIPQDGKEYAIVSVGRDVPWRVSTMDVNFKANEDGQYTITVNPEGVEMVYLHLIDNMTGADVDLLQTPRYTFNAKVTDYESRFRLVFVCGEANGDNEAPFAYVNNGEIILMGIVGDAGTASLQVIDMQGRVLVCRDALNASHISTAGMAPGVYVLRLINGDDVKTQKIVIR